MPMDQTHPSTGSMPWVVFGHRLEHLLTLALVAVVGQAVLLSHVTNHVMLNGVILAAGRGAK